MVFGFDDGWAEVPKTDWMSAPSTSSCPKAKDSVDGEKKGPVISEQPGELQPNAAGPTNVGLKLPMLVEVMPPSPEAVELAIAGGIATRAKAAASSSAHSRDALWSHRGVATPRWRGG